MVLAHAQGLSERGYEITVYGVERDIGGIDWGLWEGVRVKAYKSGPFGYAAELGADLLADDHQLVHQHGLWLYPSVVVSQWRKATGHPVVISTHGMLDPWALNNSSLKKVMAGQIFEWKNLRNASVLHCFSSEIPSARKIAPDTPTVSIANGIHIDTSTRHHDDLPSAPNRDRKSLLFLGRIHPKKGVKELLQAWAKVKEISPDLMASWRLVCAGWDDGGHQDGYELLAKSLGLEASEVTFPGPLYGESKQDALNGSDAFILPSFSEGLPIAVLEAWAAKLPVFMTQQCNLNEAFQSHSAIEIENAPQSIANGLIRHLADPELASFGQRGAEFVRRSFNWDTIIDQLSELYSCQIGGGNQCDRSDLNFSSSCTHPTDNPDISNV